jgi:hypothetical protein
MAVAQVAFTDRFWPSVHSLDATDVKRVVKAVTQLSDNPDHPSLNLHPIHGDPTGRLHSARASQEIRVLLAREGAVHLLDRAGRHDDMYDLARRTKVVLNAGSNAVRVVELSDRQSAADEPPSVAPAQPSLDERAPIFDHWADGDLKDAGFDGPEIDTLRGLRSEDDLLALEWDDDTLSLAIDLLGQTPEQWRTPSFDPVADAEERFRTAILESGALAGISPLFTPEEVAHLTQAPIEEWMVFLHPDQRAVVDRTFEGPARVRGSAGTGKTVVALHRAAALTKRFAVEGTSDHTILFTTFIKTLPPVFERLYLRLPGSDPAAVDFTNIDKLANRICREADDRVVTNPKEIDAAYASAWRRVVTHGSPLHGADLSRQYLRNEIDAVVKGRGVRSLDEYLGMERTGRRTRMPAPLRKQVWELKDTFDSEMATRGTLDFPDVVLRARDHARRRTASTYRAAIVDEAQDLTLVGLQLVRALVNGPEAADRPDGLFIVGDGAQKIYPGGFNLRQAGVEVRGRTTVLRVNYRNTAEIIGAAMAVAGKSDVDDLGDTYARGDADAETVRSHPTLKPVLVLATSFQDEVRFVCERIRSLVDSGAVAYGDIGVCAPTNRVVDELRLLLSQAGIPSQDLLHYDGTPNDLVKVGTHHRAKGLEFKVVFLPGLGADDFPRKRSAGQDELEYEEQTALAISQLFVAMTRARDGLFLLASGDPSAAIDDALDAFEVIAT